MWLYSRKNKERESKCESERDLKLVVLDKLIEVDGEHLKRDAHVRAEIEVIRYVHNRCSVVE